MSTPNDSLGFSWEFARDELGHDHYQLSPEIENFPLTEDLCAEIAYYDAMARYIAEEAERYAANHGHGHK